MEIALWSYEPYEPIYAKDWEDEEEEKRVEANGANAQELPDHWYIENPEIRQNKYTHFHHYHINDNLRYKLDNLKVTKKKIGKQNGVRIKTSK